MSETIVCPRTHSFRTFPATMRPRPRKSEVWAVQSQKSSIPGKSKSISDSTDWGDFWIVEALKSYCESTGLHGLNHIVRTDTTHREKVGWILIVLIAVAVSIVLLVISWRWNSESRTVTVIESTHYATWNVPFPAVTMCNFNRVSKTKVMSQAKIMKRPENVTAEELASLFLLIMDFTERVRRPLGEYAKLNAILEDNGLNVQSLRELLAPDCTEQILRCMWKGIQTRCDVLFQQINTSLGPCCSFNYHGTLKNNYRMQYSNSIPKLPRRVTSSGYQTGLTAVFDPKIEDYFGTFLSGYGFRINIHDAYDYPDQNAEMKIVSPRTENFISITPESTYATEDVRDLHPKSRECLFRTEHTLENLQRYSYVNCLAECRAKLFYNTCGCVPSGFLNNGSFPFCKPQAAPCIMDNMESFNGALPGLNLTLARERGIFKSTCNCLPDCELNLYPAEIATGILNRTFTYSGLNFFKDLNVSNGVIIHVYFNDLISSRYRKDIFQNWIGMLASFGGLLGLIMGFSIVTAFEFIYYLTLRPAFAYLSKEMDKRRNHVEEFNKSKLSIKSKNKERH